jgi:O-methyltransferase
MEAALRYARTIAYSSEQVLQFTYDMAVKYRDSPGIYCECGCAAGAQVIAMALGAHVKEIWAFDSFQGLPFPSNRDDQMPGIRMLADWERKVLPEPGHALLQSTGAVSVSLSDFRDNLRRAKIPNPSRIIPVEGWFEETLPDAAKDIGPIAILRLDGDLYNSTYVCLKHLYPKVIKGGLIVVDDYRLPGCRQAVVDYFDNIDQGMQFITDKDSTVAYWTK